MSERYLTLIIALPAHFFLEMPLPGDHRSGPGLSTRYFENKALLFPLRRPTKVTAPSYFKAGLRMFAHKILVFTYHKTGTVLLEQVMARIAVRFGLQVQTLYGRVSALNDVADITIVAHSLLAVPLPPGFRGVRIVRDPRDIWVSVYLYHRRCNEGWCVNVDTIPRRPIGYPQVPLSMLHLPDQRRLDFLKRLAGRSYKQNLLDRDLASGLAFELDGYTSATLDAMRAWQAHPDILDVALETLAAD